MGRREGESVSGRAGDRMSVRGWAGERVRVLEGGQVRG